MEEINKSKNRASFKNIFQAIQAGRSFKTNPYQKFRFSSVFGVFFLLLIIYYLDHWLGRYIGNVSGLVGIVGIFFFIILVIFSSDWVLTPTHFGPTYLFARTLYPLEKIKRIHVGLIETDAKALSEVMKVTGTRDAKEESVLALVQKFALPQLLIDIQDPEGNTRTISLAVRNKNIRTAGLGRLRKRLHELTPRLPAGTIDPEVWTYLGETGDPFVKV